MSVRAQELERLLTIPVAHELSSIDAEIRNSVSGLKQSFEQTETQRNTGAQLRAIDQDLASKLERLNALSREVLDLPEAQKRAIESHSAYRAGDKLVGQYAGALFDVESALTGLVDGVRRILADLPQVGSARPSQLLSTMRSEVVRGISRLVTQIEESGAALRTVQNGLGPPTVETRNLISEHEQEYAAASSENQTLQARLDSFKKLSEEIEKAQVEKSSFEQHLEALREAGPALTAHRANWQAAIGRREELLEHQAATLMGPGGMPLKISIRRSTDTERLKDALQDAVRGAAITTPEKFEALVRKVLTARDPISAWLILSDEFVSLARIGALLGTGATLPKTEQLTAAGFKESELRRIAAKLTPSAAFELSLIYPDVVPLFEYVTADGDCIPFEDASPGQQATALIQLLLEQSSGPLLIDQPEDDLDNSTILEVAERLWSSKEKRQILFSTHNPNLVVIGDAELVACCDYCHPGTSARVELAHCGAIDNPRLRDVITSVMEGGEAAFSLRSLKYGF